MNLAQPAKRYTPQEYYQLERASDYKSDYYEGEIFNMSGGTARHSLICSNINRAIGNRLEKSPCTVYESNLRLRIKANGLRCYPDVSVYREPLEYDPEDDGIETVTNPTVLIEVLSKSTEAYDRGFKASSYRRIDSLKAHLLVSQSAASVAVYVRQPNGHWDLEESNGLNGVLSITPLDVSLPLAEVYARVDFDQHEPESAKETPRLS